ncbi:Sensor histidine kinase [Crenothrix polyspora]|uniref:histidine kinase n=2 Tax=Crenothrix polyspora TaxID=360316 RepID=A0A1R4HCB5_9GAMM|nr:Sensor histidine kinase [Crenothrix polyspora]
MKIRRMLHISFFALLSLVTVSLTAVAFFTSRSMLEEEIGRNLTRDAAMLMAQVDMLMFERMQNIHSWSQMDIMQEARVRDVDKRLSQFLTDVVIGYKGMYSKLFFVNIDQRIIAASSPELIGIVHYATANWVRAEVPNGDVFIEDLQLLSPYNDASLVIRAPVQDNYSSQYMGQFYGLFDMRQLFRLLDEASRSDSGERYIVLLDAEGRAIAASGNLRKPEFLLKTTFSNWKADKDQAFFIHSGEPVIASSVLVGRASSPNYLGYVQMGWSLLVFQSTHTAYAPIYKLLEIFIGIIFFTMLLAFWLSQWISGRIASPLLGLTKWVRGVRYFEKQTPPKLEGTLEIRELEKAFATMLQQLERSREQVIQASKLAVIGEMAAIMAHEVRTPLGILSTSVQMLQREPALSAEGHEMTRFILDESSRLKRLVTTMLECSRPRKPQMLFHNVHDIVLHTLELLARQANAKHLCIERQLQAKTPVIVCDAELLTQVFLNLLHNAIQLVANEGRVCIRSTSCNQHLSIEIADNGPGIAVADYHNIFEPFFTKREGGVGLGLTVTKQIMLAHQGNIFIKQSEWGGACFVLDLPLTQE